MRRYGLVGKKLSHSFSPSYFKNKFEKESIKDAHYELIELESIEEIQQLLREGIEGFNVTIPYKSSIMQYLDGVDNAAAKVGAVNCVRREGTRYIGYNTDIFGFKQSLLQTGKVDEIDLALVLGNGGASKAVQYVLSDIQIKFMVVTRSGPHHYHALTSADIQACQLIVNTTPLGMAPHEEEAPEIPYEAIDNKHIVFDLIYNPPKTKFLKLAEERGAFIINGYEMLTLQAENSWQIWNQ